MNFLRYLIIFISSSTSFICSAQCDLTITIDATLASCSTCCDATVNYNANTSCPPNTYAWYPVDPNWPPSSGCAGYWYVLEVVDNCGCAVIDSVLIGYDTTAVLYDNSKYSIILSPNPVSNDLFIYGADNNVVVQVLSLFGEILLDEKLNSHSISLKSFPNGNYLIRLLNSDIILVRRIQIVH